MENLKYIRSIESKWRFGLICFCSFSFLYAITESVLSKYIEQLQELNIFTLIIMGAISLVIGLFVKIELSEMFDKDFEWKPKNKIEKIQNEVFCLVGIGVLYYFSQTGAMVLFFPAFESIMIHSYKLYNILFAATSFLIYVFYRLTIIKF